jgi:exodeoxyribonuclease VII large subunit
VAAKSFKTPTALAEELVARFEAAEQYGQQARHNLTSAWNFKFQAEQAWMKELRGGMQLGVRKLLDGSRSALMAKAEGLRGRVSARLSGAQQSYQKQNFKLEHGVSRVLKDKSYDLKQSQSRLGHGAQGKVSSARQSLSFAKKRCDIDRVEAILNQKREGLQTQNKRLCGGVFEARISVELELLKSKASRLKWADPRQNLKRGYAIVQRKGKSFRSVENIQKGDLVDIQLEHGKMVSRVESIEISQKRTES